MRLRIKTLKWTEAATLQLRELYQQYGYKKYRMGRFEEYSLYAANKRFLPSEHVITFTDLDGKLLALKPDVTLGIVKNTKATRVNSEKLYYTENVYRESKESHTYKEISQMGLECIGTVDVFACIEVLSLAEQSLSVFGREFVLTVSHMGFIIGLLDSLMLDEVTKLRMLNCIRSKNTNELQLTAKEAGLSKIQIENLTKLPGLYGNFPSTLQRARKIAINKTMEDAVDQLEKIYKAMRAVGLAKKMKLDFSMINDIEYYNGIIFQGYLDGLPRSVLSGGQYDGMMAKLGKDAEAIGFALYLSELVRLPEEIQAFDVEALVLYKSDVDYGALAAKLKTLRKEGLRVRAECSVPADLRYERLYQFKDGKLILWESGEQLIVGGPVSKGIGKETSKC